MDREIDARLARIVARRMAPIADGDVDQERRRARERVLAELPRLLARLTETIAELNDALGEADILLRLTAREHLPTSEAVYLVRVEGASEWEPTLSLNVDFSGMARALIERDHRRELVLSCSVFELDRPRIADLIVTLLELTYPPE